MPDRQALEALFLRNLGWIERALASICRRHGVSRDDAEDFASWAKLKLVEDDYAILGKFRDESSITTYLTVVIAMLFRDYRVQQWGRWRPSAEARRRGPVGVRLEALVYRDKFRVEQAGELLRTSGETDLSDAELRRLLAELPARMPLRPVESGLTMPSGEPSSSGADEFVRVDEAERERRQADVALASVIDLLPPEDRLIVRMRYWENLSIADIARALQIPQRPLYRRFERLLDTLRKQLEARGISRLTVQSALHDLAES